LISNLNSLIALSSLRYDGVDRQYRCREMPFLRHE
jgi:hypothetical protein